MCGIMGYIGNPTKTQKYWFLTKGLDKLEVRGRDATGVYSRETGLMKAPLAASNFLEQTNFKKFLKKVVSMDKSDIVFVHARAWTQGKPENNDNNHPIFTDRLVLIHNGIVNSKKIKDYPYKGETDTEELIAYIHSSIEKKEEDQIIDGIINVSGSLAIAVYFRESGNTYFYRHSSPMYVGKLSNSVLFSSTREILSGSIQQFREGSFFRGVEIREVPEDILLKVKKGDLSYISKVSPKPYISSYSGGAYKRSYWGHGSCLSTQESDWQDAINKRNEAMKSTLMESVDPVEAIDTTTPIESEQLSDYSPAETIDTKDEPPPFMTKTTRRVAQVVKNIERLKDGSFFKIRHNRNNYIFTRYNEEYPLLGANSYAVVIEVEGVKTHSTVSRSINYPSFHVSRPELERDIEKIFYGVSPFESEDFVPVGGEPKN